MTPENTVALTPVDLIDEAQADFLAELQEETEARTDPQAASQSESLADSQGKLRAESPAEQFLQIYLAGDVPFLLPVISLVEIMKIPMEQVVPMFQMAPWVMGVYNCRGEVLWLADLNHFLGMTPWYEQQGSATKHTAVIVRGALPADAAMGEKQATLGLIVSRVEGMVSGLPEAIEPLSPGHALEGVEARVLQFLNGCWRDEAGTVQLILDSSAILAAMVGSEP